MTSVDGGNTPDATSPAPAAAALSGDQMAGLRARLGLTVDQFAAELGVTPHVLEAWERGSLGIPRRHAQIIAYRMALADREAALAASGLAECGWFRQWEDAEVPSSRGAWERHVADGRRHTSFCPVCQARETFLREHFPPLPALPVPRWFELLRGFSSWLRRWPDWARPPIVGALLVGGFTLVRVLLALPALARDGTVATGLSSILVAAAAGGAGGALFVLLRRLAPRQSR